MPEEFNQPDVPQSPKDLHRWISANLDLTIATAALIEGHCPPFDYLAHAFFEGNFVRTGIDWAVRDQTPAAPPDCVVWANRGGGKTFLGALATLLDLVFKPGIQVRILAGSLEQSQKMFEHLRAFLEHPRLASLIDGKLTARRVRLGNGSSAQVLAASETSIRGTRVQKVRCDEVDLFEPALWRAAQLTTRSLKLPGPWGPTVRGAIEALSTMHNPYGLMWELVTGDRGPHDEPSPNAAARKPTPAALARPRPVFRWGVVDALETCPEEHDCKSCGLFPECAGKAKRTGGSAGHMTIDDALTMKSRVDEATWQSEMLCLRPRRTDSVYPEFEAALHIVGDGDVRLAARTPVAYLAGMDFGIRSEAVVLLASLDRTGVIVIEREHAATDRTMADHVEVIRAWIDAGFARAQDPDAGEINGLKWIGADPAGKSRSDQTGRSNVQVLNKAGFAVKTAAPGLDTGIRMVRARLAPALGQPSPVPGAALPARAPKLFIHRRCRRLIECLQRYRYPEGDLETLQPEKDGTDHACDALRYLVVNLDRPTKTQCQSYT